MNFYHATEVASPDSFTVSWPGSWKGLQDRKGTTECAALDLLQCGHTRQWGGSKLATQDVSGQTIDLFLSIINSRDFSQYASRRERMGTRKIPFIRKGLI